MGSLEAGQLMWSDPGASLAFLVCPQLEGGEHTWKMVVIDQVLIVQGRLQQETVFLTWTRVPLSYIDSLTIVCLYSHFDQNERHAENAMFECNVCFCFLWKKIKKNLES